MASGRHREGSRRTLKQRDFEGPTRSDIGKASGRHREIMVEHGMHREMDSCIGKIFSFGSSLHPAAIWGKDHRDLAGGRPLCYGLLAVDNVSYVHG